MTEEQKDYFGDYALMRVPTRESRSTLNMFFVYTGVLAVVAAIWAGSGLAAMYDATTMIVVTLIGNLILGILGFLIATVGGYNRAATGLILRYPFGRIGSMLGSLVVAGLPLIMWFAVETWLFGVVLNAIWPDQIWANVAVASIWGGFLMMTTAYFGYRAISLLSYITVPFWFTLIVIGFGAAIDVSGGWQALWTARPETIAPIGAGITFVVGVYASGCNITSDVSRYGKKPWAGGLAWFIHVVFLMTLLLFIGGGMTLVTGAPNVIIAMGKIGLGLAALLLAAFGQWSTNDNNLWSAYLGWVNVIGRFKRGAWIIIIGVLGTLIAGIWAGLYGASLDPFISFGIFLGYFIPPAGAALIADFYIFRPYVVGIKDPYKRYKFGPGTEYPWVNLPGLIAMIVGGIVGYYTTIINLGVPVLNGLFTSFFLYLALVVPMHKAGIRYEFGKWVERPNGF
jgi:cytosine permease